ncbi:small ribosomal subunit protein eS17 isoform X1 [Gorilla gorilla gorilla]|uniref:small ribosomal subunit protein eS17 isoform X1 n=1 Tax=Gorilla gorilla gorilla TaxID=9595 RepID=UPI003009FFA3
MLLLSLACVEEMDATLEPIARAVPLKIRWGREASPSQPRGAGSGKGGAVGGGTDTLPTGGARRRRPRSTPPGGAVWLPSRLRATVAGRKRLSGLSFNRLRLCFLFPLLPRTRQHGPRSHQNREEGGPGHHRKVLHAPGQRLPHEQARVRGDRHYPQQKAPQQDSRVSRAFLGLRGSAVCLCALPPSDSGRDGALVVSLA